MSDEHHHSSDVGEEIAGAIARHDRARAITLAIDAVDSAAVSIDDLYRQLSAMLVGIGDAWQRGTTEVWQEHYASGVVRTIVEALATRVEGMAESSPRGGTVVLAAPSDEYHDLGLRMLADRFTLTGWRAHFLGADVPLPEVVRAVRALQADAVAMSASTHFHRLRIREYVEGLCAADPNLRIWVGGPAFAHEHDGWDDGMILDPSAIPSPGGG